MNLADLAATSDHLREAQLLREKAARDQAFGRRVEAAASGELGPVLRRWVAATIAPVSERLRGVAEASARKDGPALQALLSSPAFGVPEATAGRSRDLAPVLGWCLRGSSAGRSLGSTTYADDLVLSVVGTALTMLSVAKDPLPLTRVVMACGDAARECALGQFITQVQGAKAMQRVRSGDAQGWRQASKMDAVAALLSGQARSALEAIPEEDWADVGSKEVISVLTLKGEARRLDLRRPDKEDWKLLDVARKVKGEKDKHRDTWASFAMIILCAAQAEAGLFALVKSQATVRKKASGNRAAHALVLTPEAWEAISKDLEKWLQLGFIHEPMLTEPARGDYLSVKHRPVAGRRGPMGMRTEVMEDTSSWNIAADTIARTPWAIAEETLKFVKETDLGRDLAAKSVGAEPRREMILGAASRLATAERLYFPIYMDFRGRVYLRPTITTYQGGDLQKALLTFANLKSRYEAYRASSRNIRALAHQAANLYGNGLDKAPMKDRVEWFQRETSVRALPWLENMVARAEEPLQLYTLLSRYGTSLEDTIPCQLDGTCNGLQHLSAMFKDDVAAPYVNLVDGELPGDVYALVAGKVSERLAACDANWARRMRTVLKIDRKFCKKAVMVLPYGGTRGTIDEAVFDSALPQAETYRTPQGFAPWHECLKPVWSGAIHQSHPGEAWDRDEDAIKGDYLVFRERDLANHPLFRLDCQRLGGIVWAVIQETLPKAMEAMQTFRTIAKAVGERSLEWSTGFARPGEHPLWVVQAKARSASSSLSLKGLHLPDSVRGLAVMVGKDEIDPNAHVSGIVANFVHSQDARHMAATAGAHCAGKGIPDFGAIHDGFITRPGQVETLARELRGAFYRQYGVSNPLRHPVRVVEPGGGGCIPFTDWYALADWAGTTFPGDGRWDADEVLHSRWFFS